MAPLTSREKRWLLAFAVILIILTTLPYAAAFEFAGDEWAFSGFLIGVEDGNSYVAKMLRGNQGDWLFKTPYTTIEQPGVLVFLPYLILGKLAAGEALHLQLVSLFHLFRAVAIGVYVLGIYRFAAAYLESYAWRRWAVLLAAAGSGIGWIIFPWVGLSAWPLLPLSFISPETFGFLGALAVPHHAMARGLMLLSLLWIFRDISAGSYSWKSPVLVLLTFLFNPLAGVSMVLIVSIFHLAHVGALLGQKSLRSGLEAIKASLWGFSLSIPYVVYLAFAYHRQAFLRGWAEQNLILSPHAGYYFLAYGVLIIPAFFGLRRLLEVGNLKSLLLSAWLVSLPFLPYLPVGVQRRLPEAGWVALVVAAALGLERMSSRIHARTIAAGLMVTGLVSPALILWGAWQTALNPAWPAFVPAEIEAAFDVISRRAKPGDTLIADYNVSNAAPAWAPVQVPIGHGPESVGGSELRVQVNQFLKAEPAEARAAFLREKGADWVLLESPANPSLDTDGPWQEIDTGSDVRLYQMVLDP
ncbi:MAG: hypothetical protein ACLFWD_01920 [Anaerolineales bacterium]